MKSKLFLWGAEWVGNATAREGKESEQKGQEFMMWQRSQWAKTKGLK